MTSSEEAQQEVIEIEKKLGLPKDFILSIISNDNDWEFIIKLHSLIETLINQLISHIFGKELEGDLSRLNIRIKLSMIYKKGFISKKQLAFLENLSVLRNRYVHNIKNIVLDLKKISKEANIGTYSHFEYNKKLRLVIWVHTVISIVTLSKQLKVEKMKDRVREMEGMFAGLKIKELMEEKK